MAQKKLSKEIFNLICTNCQAFLCETDGTYLYVKNLDILPKLQTNRRAKSNHIAKDIICSCGEKNRIFLQRPKEEDGNEGSEETRKFSIFRSRL